MLVARHEMPCVSARLLIRRGTLGADGADEARVCRRACLHIIPVVVGGIAELIIGFASADGSAALLWEDLLDAVQVGDGIGLFDTGDNAADVKVVDASPAVHAYFAEHACYIRRALGDDMEISLPAIGERHGDIGETRKVDICNVGIFGIVLEDDGAVDRVLADKLNVVGDGNCGQGSGENS